MTGVAAMAILRGASAEIVTARGPSDWAMDG
jgi:hypothetical protein